MEHARIKARYFTWPSLLLLVVIVAGAMAVAWRMMHGLGATTNLSDDWPWGIWKGFNVLCLIALGAGGFTSAAFIYIFGGDQYHGFARSSALWGLLCYCFAGASLMVDIAIPWRIVNPIWMWPEQSILFEVAWCVMLYITVLALEVAPTVFERFKSLGWLESMWRHLTTPYAVLALSFFTYIMTHSPGWAAASLVFFSLLSLAFTRVRKKPSTPMLLIMFGVILSILHQSSLGSLFLLMPDKLSHYWWSPRLPINFLLSAIMVGLSVSIIERNISSRAFKRPLPDKLLKNISRATLILIGFYTALRLADVFIEFGSAEEFGGVKAAFGGQGKSVLFMIEMIGGLIIPGLILVPPKGRERNSWRLVAAILIVLGVIVNRLNVAFMGMMIQGAYIPSLIEIIFSAATFSAIIFLYTIGVKMMPVYIDRGRTRDIISNEAATST